MVALSLQGCALTEKLKKEAQAAIAAAHAPDPQPPSSSGIAPAYLDIMKNLSTPDPARQAIYGQIKNTIQANQRHTRPAVSYTDSHMSGAWTRMCKSS